MEIVFKKRIKLASYEVGPNAEATAAAILAQFQEVAGDQASGWNLTAFDLFKGGRTWVLSRYHLEFLRPLRYADELDLVTWPIAFDTNFTMRDFEVFEPGGELVARASTSWAIIDLATKKPVRLAEIVPAEFSHDRRAVGTSFPTLPRLVDAERELALPVKRRDLDINAHVNHAVYLQWAEEAMPREVLKSHRMARVEIAYKADVRHGETIVSRRGPMTETPEGLVCIHQIVNEGTRVELTRLRTTWSPRA